MKNQIIVAFVKSDKNLQFLGELDLMRLVNTHLKGRIATRNRENGKFCKPYLVDAVTEDVVSPNSPLDLVGEITLIGDTKQIFYCKYIEDCTLEELETINSYVNTEIAENGIKPMIEQYLKDNISLCDLRNAINVLPNVTFLSVRKFKYRNRNTDAVLKVKVNEQILKLRV